MGWGGGGRGSCEDFPAELARLPGAPGTRQAGGSPTAEPQDLPREVLHPGGRKHAEPKSHVYMFNLKCRSILVTLN